MQNGFEDTFTATAMGALEVFDCKDPCYDFLK